MPRKKKPPYVAPVGHPIPRIVAGLSSEEKWNWIAACCDALATWIPYADEPDTMTWSDPGESIRKERMEKIQVEEDFSGETEDSFDHLLENTVWPESSEQAAFLVRERLEWAAKTARALAAAPHCADGPVFVTPATKGRVIIRWLAMELYDSGVSFPKKWWNSSTFENYYR